MTNNQTNNQSIIPSTDVIQLTLTLKMTTAQIVKTSVTVSNNSPIQDYVHPDDRTQAIFEMTPGFKPFTNIYLTIISRVRFGYEIVDSQRGATRLVGYNHLLSNKHEWNNCFIKNAHKVSRILSDLFVKTTDFQLIFNFEQTRAAE